MELRPMELRDTAEMMNSTDYKERFRAEYHQLRIRYEKLKKMLSLWDKGELKFAPTCPRSIYSLQIKAMGDYIATLEARAAIEGIKVISTQKCVLFLCSKHDKSLKGAWPVTPMTMEFIE